MDKTDVKPYIIHFFKKELNIPFIIEKLRNIVIYMNYHYDKYAFSPYNECYAHIENIEKQLCEIQSYILKNNLIYIKKICVCNENLKYNKFIEDIFLSLNIKKIKDSHSSETICGFKNIIDTNIHVYLYYIENMLDNIMMIMNSKNMNNFLFNLEKYRRKISFIIQIDKFMMDIYMFSHKNL